VAVVLVAVLELAACGPRPEISEEAGADLRARALDITQDVSRLDVEGARAGLTGLTKAVGQWNQRDELSDERARRVLAAASRVEEKITELEARLRPAPSTQTPSRVGEDSNGGDRRGDEGKDKGKGKGEDSEEDGDD
jgi:hypothetical protein